MYVYANAGQHMSALRLFRRLEGSHGNYLLLKPVSCLHHMIGRDHASGVKRVSALEDIGAVTEFLVSREVSFISGTDVLVLGELYGVASFVGSLSPVRASFRWIGPGVETRAGGLSQILNGLHQERPLPLGGAATGDRAGSCTDPARLRSRVHYV